MRNEKISKEKEVQEKLNRLNRNIAECEHLRAEWEERISEVKELEETYKTLINRLRKRLDNE